MLLKSPINLKTAVQFEADLPAAVDVVIIGGGVIGISTALYLAEQGVRVLVCEKGRVAGEQSSRNWGWIRQTGRDAAELPIMIESRRIWQTMASRTGEESLSFNECGVLYLADKEATLAGFHEFVELAASHGLVSRVISANEVAARLPMATHKWIGGLLTESDGRVEPWYAIPAMARAAQRAGATIKESCAVREILSTNGVAGGVVTEHGVVNADRVLLAGGAWSSLLARQSNVRIPQLSVMATVARIENTSEFLTGNVWDDKLGIARRLDGGYTVALTDLQECFIGPDSFRYFKPFLQAAIATRSDNHFSLASPVAYPDAWSTPRRWSADEISPFERCRVLDPLADARVVDRMISRLKKRSSGCSNASASHALAGMIDAMPDFVPVLDQSSKLSGLFIATGFSGHGFGIGPAAGRVMADVMQGKSCGHELKRFRQDRFNDGSRLCLGPH
jgi:glycine/D-amino acid oxidase-like deaminating enzyme